MGDKYKNALQRNKGELIFLSIVIVFTIVCFYQSLGYELVASRAPFTVIAFMCVMLIWRLIYLLKGKKTDLVQTEDDNNNESTDVRNEANENTLLIKIFFAITALVFAIYFIGFYLSIILYVVLSLRFISRYSWFKSCISSVVLTVVLFVFFNTALKLKLYEGIIFDHFF